MALPTDEVRPFSTSLIDKPEPNARPLVRSPNNSIRIPPSSRKKAVISYGGKTGYAIESDFLAINDPAQESRRQLAQTVVDALNLRKHIFPMNRKIGLHLWVVAFLATLAIVAILFWILGVAIIFFLLNPIVLCGGAWLFWTATMKIPVFIVAMFESRRMAPLYRFVVEQNVRLLHEASKLECSTDGFYLELSFDIDEIGPSAEEREGKLIIGEGVLNVTGIQNTVIKQAEEAKQ